MQILKRMKAVDLWSGALQLRFPLRGQALRSPVPVLSRSSHRSCREHASARRQDGVAPVQAGQVGRVRPMLPLREKSINHAKTKNAGMSLPAFNPFNQQIYFMFALRTGVFPPLKVALRVTSAPAGISAGPKVMTVVLVPANFTSMK